MNIATKIEYTVSVFFVKISLVLEVPHHFYVDIVLFRTLSHKEF